MAIVIGRPPWSKQVKDTISYIEKKKYEKGDRLAKVNNLKELIYILGISTNGWNQWLNSAVMEEFSEEDLTVLSLKLRDMIIDFLKTDYAYTKNMEDKQKKKKKQKVPMQKPKENNRYIA